MSRVLLERFLSAFPELFLKRLLERQFPLYQQALDMVLGDHQAWSLAEALALLPHARRALWEAELRKTAIECGLKPLDLSHNGNNSSCVNVKAKRIILTAHFVDSPGEFVREAESRKQNAGVNKWLNHHIDQRLLTHPIPALDDKSIYVNLLHGAGFPTSRKSDTLQIDPTTCFLHIAIPAADSKQYLAECNWSAQELLPHYAATEQSAAAPEVKVADRAQPRTKKQNIS